MRKVILLSLSIFLVLITCTAIAEEIGIFGITWLSDADTTVQALKQNGYVFAEIKPELGNENNSYIVTDDGENYRPDIVTEYEMVSRTMVLRNVLKGKMGGYPLKELALTYAYDGEYKLIAIKVELINGKYDSLKEKLNRVYGEGKYSITEEGIESILWKGDNNSAVLLYTDSEGYNFTLMYGRLDAEEILANCLISDPDDISGL